MTDPSNRVPSETVACASEDDKQKNPKRERLGVQSLPFRLMDLPAGVSGVGGRRGKSTTIMRRRGC
jgi:hypothetical protein